MDRADLDVDGLEAAEGALSVGELLVGFDGRCGIERRGFEAGAQHVDAIEGGFGRDLWRVARERQGVIGDAIL